MRPSILSAATAALLALTVAVPATAQTAEPIRLQPCTQAGTKLIPGTPVEATVDGPTLLDGELVMSYVLDLSGQPVAVNQDMKTTATVDASISWIVVANDYDLGLNGTVTEGFQPIDEAVESTSATKRAHCSTVTVSVVNFNATGLDPVDLSLSARL